MDGERQSDLPPDGAGATKRREGRAALRSPFGRRTDLRCWAAGLTPHGLALCDSHLRVWKEPRDGRERAQAAIPHLPRIRMNALGARAAKSGIRPWPRPPARSACDVAVAPANVNCGIEGAGSAGIRLRIPFWGRVMTPIQHASPKSTARPAPSPPHPAAVDVRWAQRDRGGRQQEDAKAAASRSPFGRRTDLRMGGGPRTSMASLFAPPARGS